MILSYFTIVLRILFKGFKITCKVDSRFNEFLNLSNLN